MTRITAHIISEDPEVYAGAYGPVDGKFGLYIGTLDESPSGCMRPMDLMTSQPIYATAEDATTAAESIIAATKAQK